MLFNVVQIYAYGKKHTWALERLTAQVHQGLYSWFTQVFTDRKDISSRPKGSQDETQIYPSQVDQVKAKFISSLHHSTSRRKIQNVSWDRGQLTNKHCSWKTVKCLSEGSSNELDFSQAFISVPLATKLPFTSFLPPWELKKEKALQRSHAYVFLSSWQKHAIAWMQTFETPAE